VRIHQQAPLVLGSGSPRRREILASLGVPFVVHVAAANEDVHPGESPDAYLERVVRAKLAACRTGAPPGPILVADTTVVCDGAILGKPADEEEAYGMIQRLAGRTHEVKTRFAIDELHEETVTTRVTFRAVDDDEARAYARSGEGLDKAGGYAVQGRAAGFAQRIDGSYSNVVGLPACEVVVALRRLALW
jgi:septum formation protein